MTSNSTKGPDAILAGINTFQEALAAAQNFWAGFSKYAVDFMIPQALSMQYVGRVEQQRMMTQPWPESFAAYLKLNQFCNDLFLRAAQGSLDAVYGFQARELKRLLDGKDGVENASDIATAWSKLTSFIHRQARNTDMVTNGLPEAIADVIPEYGFHFESDPQAKVAETDRFVLYRVAPTDAKVAPHPNAKPLIILPPYVLGSNILAFLPGENKSYAHAFANQGVPTYIRVMKPIAHSEAVQTMTGEDDTLDTVEFCRRIYKTHDRPVTLNGYCQGGFSALCNLLTGKLDGIVDALITCVSPMDGTRSEGLAYFLQSLPQRFNDLAYGVKKLPNGNSVADGTLMGWVYKLKSIESEAPLAAYFRDLSMFSRSDADAMTVSKTAAALNYWLNYERTDLPMAITRMSFASYNTPIADDGTLPVRLFNEPLKLDRLKQMGLKWLICYGENDDLVEKETALAPLQWVEAEVTPFPKGHVAIATSWSNPKSACALQTRFGKGDYRGPVRFQLDLDAEA
jgi:hypothetical protein